MIEKHVTSLEWSKKLKELGVKQKSIFYYDDKDELHYGKSIFSKTSAFLSSELDAVLPEYTDKGRYSCGKADEEYYCCYDRAAKGKIIFDKNGQDAKAAMLCYLIENGIVKVEEVGR